MRLTLGLSLCLLAACDDPLTPSSAHQPSSASLVSGGGTLEIRAIREVRDAVGSTLSLEQLLHVAREADGPGVTELVVSRITGDALSTEPSSRVRMHVASRNPLAAGHLEHTPGRASLDPVPLLAQPVRGALARREPISYRPEYGVGGVDSLTVAAGARRAAVLRAGADGERAVADGLVEFWKQLPGQRLLVVVDEARDSIVSVRFENASGRNVTVSTSAGGSRVTAIGGVHRALTLDVRKMPGGR